MRNIVLKCFYIKFVVASQIGLYGSRYQSSNTHSQNGLMASNAVHYKPVVLVNETVIPTLLQCLQSSVFKMITIIRFNRLWNSLHSPTLLLAFSDGFTQKTETAICKFQLIHSVSLQAGKLLSNHWSMGKPQNQVGNAAHLRYTWPNTYTQ